MTALLLPAQVEIRPVVFQQKLVRGLVLLNLQLRLTSRLEFERHHLEYQLYVAASLGRSLDQLEVLCLSKALHLLEVAALLQCQEVFLVGHQQNNDGRGGVVSHKGQPAGNTLEGLLPMRLEDQDSAVSILEVGWDQTPVLLLAGGVPELQLVGLS